MFFHLNKHSIIIKIGQFENVELKNCVKVEKNSGGCQAKSAHFEENGDQVGSCKSKFISAASLCTIQKIKFLISVLRPIGF